MEERNVPNRIDRYEKVYKGQLSQVFSAESVVPDTMPDVGNILFADAQVYIRQMPLFAVGFVVIVYLRMAQAYIVEF